MGIFSKRKIGSDEFEQLLRRIVLLTSELDVLKGKFDIITTNTTSLRALVNRKFGDYSKEDEEDLNNPDGLDSLRKLSHGNNKSEHSRSKSN